MLIARPLFKIYRVNARHARTSDVVGQGCLSLILYFKFIGERAKQRTNDMGFRIHYRI
jgi:hypothetical protein